MHLTENMISEEKRTPMKGFPYIYIKAESELFFSRRCNSTSLEEFKKEFSNLLRASDKHTPILIDLLDVKNMYSSVFEVLLVALRVAKLEGRSEDLASNNLSVSILRNGTNSAFFHISGINRLFRTFQEEKDFWEAYEEEC